MNERIYKAITNNGVASLVLGIITLCVGVAAGTILIITGAKVLKKKKDIIF